MDTNLLIKYNEQSGDKTGFDLGLLGESFTGMNEIFKEIFEISQIQGELVVRTSKIENGSIDVHNLIQVVLTAFPFKDVKDFLDFIQVCDVSMHQQASSFFTTFGQVHKSVNDYFRENQFDNNIVTGLVVVFLTKMMEWSSKQKKQITTENENGEKISERYAKGLRNLVIHGRYKKALKPISENSISSIQISAVRKNSYMISIDESSLESYLPEEEQILPDLENGKIVNMTGEILALQSTRGESLKFKANEIDPRFQLLTAYPQDNKQTEDYKDYYKKMVNISAEVYRKTLYKKPEIIIREIELSQQELFPTN